MLFNWINVIICLPKSSDFLFIGAGLTAAPACDGDETTALFLLDGVLDVDFGVVAGDLAKYLNNVLLGVPPVLIRLDILFESVY